MRSEEPFVYVSYDRFPAPKGAATHIRAFTTALGRRFQNVDLITVQSPEVDGVPWQSPGVTHVPFEVHGNSFFERVLSFRAQLLSRLQRQCRSGKTAPVIHFRSIYEGYPIAQNKEKFCRKLVYEVNGFPSVELKYHYPEVADDRELLRKLESQEQVCLEAADLILTVSEVNSQFIQSRGVPRESIRVIPNGVDLEVFSYQATETISEQKQLSAIYCGTLAPWQGVSFALEAIALYLRDHRATLKIVGHAQPSQKKRLHSRIWELGLSDEVMVLGSVTQTETADLLHDCDVALVPLTRCDRNTQQGCCPLKLLEAMSTGTPVIASDLPAVQELASDNHEALLVRPSSAKCIKDGLLRIRNQAGLAQRLGRNAHDRVRRDFTWATANTSLLAAYDELV